jgi:hypothetical protein
MLKLSFPGRRQFLPRPTPACLRGSWCFVHYPDTLPVRRTKRMTSLCHLLLRSR